MWRPISILLSVITVVAHARGLRNGGFPCSSSINDVIRLCTIATGFTFQAFDPIALGGLCLNAACRTAAIQIGTLTEGCVVYNSITLRTGDVKKFERACREDKHSLLRGRQSVPASTQQSTLILTNSTASASIELPKTVLGPSDEIVSSSTKPKESNQENENLPAGDNKPPDAPFISMDPHTPPSLSSDATHQQKVHGTTMSDAPTKISFKAIGLIVAIGLVSTLALIGAVYHVYKRHEEHSHRNSIDPPALVPITFDKLLSPGTMLAGMMYKQPRSLSNTSTERLECSNVLDDEELLSHRLSVSDVEDVRVIGHGGSGIVYLVKYRETTFFASKRLIPDALTRHKLIGFITEIKLVATLFHPHIVSFIGVTWTNELDMQALFEYMPNGNLQHYLTHERQHATRDSSWTMEKIQMTIDIMQALVYVHSMLPVLVHRDLKSSNVLLNEYKRAKLSDFGASRFQSQDGSMTTGMGTSRWMAPEVLIGGGDYDQSCDIYSFGVLLTELDTHEAPFSDIRTMDTNEHLSNLMLLQMVALGRLIPSFRPCCPRIVQELGQQCMSYHRTERPTAKEILYVLQAFKSSFVQEIHL